MSLEWFGQQVVGRGQKIDHVCFLVVRFQRLAAGPLFVKHEPVRILQVAEHRVSACQCLTRGYLVSSGLMVWFHSPWNSWRSMGRAAISVSLILIPVG